MPVFHSNLGSRCDFERLFVTQVGYKSLYTRRDIPFRVAVSTEAYNSRVSREDDHSGVYPTVTCNMRFAGLKSDFGVSVMISFGH